MRVDSWRASLCFAALWKVVRVDRRVLRTTRDFMLRAGWTFSVDSAGLPLPLLLELDEFFCFLAMVCEGQ